MSPTFQKHRILILEDEWLVALDTAELVKELGFEVIGPVATVAKAFEIIETATADAALLDINLGAEYSYPFALAMQQKNIPVTFVTGCAEADIRPEFRSWARLEKPVSLQPLKTALLRMLET